MVGRSNHLAEVGLALSKHIKQSGHIRLIVQDLMSKVLSLMACLNFDYYNAISHDIHETEIPAFSSPRIQNRLSVAIHDCIDIATVLLSSYGIFTAALNFEYLTACVFL